MLQPRTLSGRLTSRHSKTFKALQDIAPDLLEDKYAAAEVVSMSMSIVASSQQTDPSEIGLFDTPYIRRGRAVVSSWRRNPPLLESETTRRHFKFILLLCWWTLGQKWSSIIQVCVLLSSRFLSLTTLAVVVQCTRYLYWGPFESWDIWRCAIFWFLLVLMLFRLIDIFSFLLRDFIGIICSWVVRPREALYNLDNIQLSKLFPDDESVDAIFAFAHMAENFTELIKYKWPSWLRAQTEKQRVIWAYKILFLDVLFPMDLKKVIFVDADQDGVTSIPKNSLRQVLWRNLIDRKHLLRTNLSTLTFMAFLSNTSAIDCSFPILVRNVV